MATKKISNKERKMNRLITVFAWCLMGLGSVAMLWFYVFSSNHVSTNDAQVEQYITPLSSKVSGYIQSVNFEENQFVHHGDTLVIIDRRELMNEVAMASANLQSATQQIETIERGVDTRESDAGMIDATIDAANVEVWKTEQDYKRYKNLLEQDAATKQQFEAVEAVYHQAKAKLLSLQQQKNTVYVAASEQKTKIAPAKSHIQQQKAVLANAQLQLSFTYVIAPYNGWVGKRNLQVGQLVKAGQTLVQVVSEEKWIVANFKETQLGEIDMKSLVDIKVDAYPQLKLSGKIASLSPVSGSKFSLMQTDNATGNFVKIEQRFPVKITLMPTQSNQLLRAGMNVMINAEKVK